MLKVSHFLGESEFGVHAIPLFGPADDSFEKIAAPSLLPEVVRYIEALTPIANSQYVLVNAMGAGEYYGSNINGDYFSEASLIHRPDDWDFNPLLDKIKSKSWPYGFPTFYNAHPFAHHRNKDASRAFGVVELATWNDHMKRVELVVRVDKDKCEKFGGVPVWDKLKIGKFPDVSMGTKVPFDTCSICLDKEKYQKALGTYDPKKHPHPGQAALEYHKKLQRDGGSGIRGLSITRADYCDHAKRMMNRILPDGRKVFVLNDFPRFFDISFVFIGADKTAKTMLFIKRSMSSAEEAENLGYSDGQMGKVASVSDETLKMAFLGKSAKYKESEIVKDTIPSQFAAKAVPILTEQEPDLPDPILKLMGRLPLEKALATTAGLGMVLRPREFQRIVIIQLGNPSLADELDKSDTLFSKSDEVEPMDMKREDFMPSLARLLLPLLALRSALGPIIEKRILVASGRSKKDNRSATSHPSELLRKIGSAYNGYRLGVMDLVANTQDFLSSAAANSDRELYKLAAAPVEEMFTPLTAAYLKEAFLDERPIHIADDGVLKVSELRPCAGVERGLPSKNTWSDDINHVSGE